MVQLPRHLGSTAQAQDEPNDAANPADAGIRQVFLIRRRWGDAPEWVEAPNQPQIRTKQVSQFNRRGQGFARSTG